MLQFTDMIFYIIITAILVTLSFITGFVLNFNGSSQYQFNKLIFIKFEDLILELFSSINSLLNFEKVIQSIIDLINKTNIFSNIILLRYDGTNLLDVINDNVIQDNRITDFLQDFSQIDSLYETKNCKMYGEYFECDSDTAVFLLIDNQNKKDKSDKAEVYPISFDFFGVKYFLILYYKRSKLKKAAEKSILFIKRQLYLIFYLKEISSRFKENFEFLDGVFNKNPIPMCVTDNEGIIIKLNKGLGQLFTQEFNNIKQLIDPNSFNEVVNGLTLEKEYNYKKMNLKVRGIPFYSTSGDIRGCLFTILDDSLQYMLFKKLEASEESYKKFLKELPIGLVIVDNKGMIFFANDNFIIMLGFSDPKKVNGKYLQEFFEVPYGDFGDIAGRIEEKTTLFFKFQLKSKYGNRVFSVHLQRIYEGNEGLVEAIFQDVSLENRLYTQLEEKSKVIEEELTTAKRIWEHILSIPPIYTSLIRFETFFKPSSQLGGDFYDIIQIDDVHVGVVIADVSGHGVSASLITSMLKMLVEFAPKDPHRIDDMVSYLNIVLMKVLPEDQFITLFYGIIDTRNYLIEYINCGHPFPLVYDEKNNLLTVLKGLTYPLGTKRTHSYIESIMKAELPESCKILFYTDGLLTFKKPERLIKLEDLIEIFKKSVFVQIKDVLNDMYLRILKMSSQFTDDDVSMLLIVLNKKLALKKHLSIPSNVLEIDNAIVKIMESISISKIIFLDEDDKWKLYTALYEAIINSVEHGNKFNVQRRVSIIYRIFRDWLVFKVRDEGIGFSEKNIPNPLDDNNVLKPSGRGVYMIKKLMNKVKHNRIGNEVTMFLKVKRVVESE